MDHIENEEQLDDLLTRPSEELISFMGSLEGPLLVCGASGKMGPTLSVMARRATIAAGNSIEIIAVARFATSETREWLDLHGIKTVSGDLLDRESVRRLPEAPNVIYMAGKKFGTSDNPAVTWSMNTLAPANVAERYANACIVALSTGCVYPLREVKSGGSTESDPLTPIGEYANSCVARERIFEYQSMEHETRVALLRLNYALDLRYGVFVDIASKVFAGEAVDLSMGYVNCIWQADANEMILRSLDLATAPATAYNLTGQDVLSVRNIADQFGELLGKQVEFKGEEREEALLSDPSKLIAILGQPRTPLKKVIEWTARWIRDAKPLLGKPTHYEVSDGRY